MKKAVNNAFNSDFGFSSPGFNVDEYGNITAKSVITVDDESDNIVDYTVTDNGTSFFFSGILEENPTIELVRGTTYRFHLDLDNFQFFLYKQDGNTEFNLGLNHSSGDQNSDALGKNSGILTITVPSDYTNENEIFYNNQLKNSQGTFELKYPIGIFNELTSNQGIFGNSATLGTLKVTGGADLTGDIFVNGEIKLTNTEFSKISSTNNIIVKVNSIEVGEISSSGLEIPLNNSTINNGILINSTVNQLPITNTEIANKIYVDNTATAMAIALGI